MLRKILALTATPTDNRDPREIPEFTTFKDMNGSPPNIRHPLLEEAWIDAIIRNALARVPLHLD